MKNCERMYQDDPEAFFNWFYETYKRFVFKGASKYFSNPSDIEDLTQDVWLSISRRGDQLCTYSPAQHFSYLAATVRNKAISSMRKHHDTISLEDITPLSTDYTDAILEEIDRRILLERFRCIWSNIPSSERELLERKYFLLESDTEIAAIMGIQKNSVRMALSRSRKTALAYLIFCTGTPLRKLLQCCFQASCIIVPSSYRSCTHIFYTKHERAVAKVKIATALFLYKCIKCNKIVWQTGKLPVCGEKAHCNWRQVGFRPVAVVFLCLWESSENF